MAKRVRRCFRKLFNLFVGNTKLAKSNIENNAMLCLFFCKRIFCLLFQKFYDSTNFCLLLTNDRIIIILSIKLLTLVRCLLFLLLCYVINKRVCYFGTYLIMLKLNLTLVRYLLIKKVTTL